MKASSSTATRLYGTFNGYPERSGLTGVFTVVVFSDDHGMRKPDRRLFDIAAQRIAIPPDRLVMVGDSLTHDVAGSQKAGWHGFWLNRDGSAYKGDIRPDAELESLHELPEALASTG